MDRSYCKVDTKCSFDNNLCVFCLYKNACSYKNIHKYIYIHIYICIYIHVYIHIYTYMYVYLHLYIFICICMYISISFGCSLSEERLVRVNVYSHVHPYTYVHIHIYTYMYICICSYVHVCIYPLVIDVCDQLVFSGVWHDSFIFQQFLTWLILVYVFLFWMLLGSYVINRMLTIRLVQWLVVAIQERKKERKMLALDRKTSSFFQ